MPQAVSHDTINYKKVTNADGGSGSGRHPKGSGRKVDAEIVKRYNDRLIGIRAACGIIINSISQHALKRIIQRGITEEKALDLFENAPIVYPGNVPGTICQQKGNLRAAFDKETGSVLSVIILDELEGEE